MGASWLVPLLVTLGAIAGAHGIGPRYTGRNPAAIFLAAVVRLAVLAVTGVVILIAWLLWFLW